MTDNRTSQAVRQIQSAKEPWLGTVNLDVLVAIEKKYTGMERAHEAIRNGECHPSQIEEGERRCHAKRVGDCCCVCAALWSEFAIVHDPLAK